MKNSSITIELDFELSDRAKALLAALSLPLPGNTPSRPIAQWTPDGFVFNKNTTSITPPAPGEYWPGQGGHFICTLPALLGLPARHLIIGTGEAEKMAFGPYEEVPDANSHIDGRANTAALICAGKEHKAAHWAAAYTADGHADFFLPSRLDLLMAYICAPQLFNKSGYYWSSTQYSRYGAFVQYFEDGLSYWDFKGIEFRVRPCRVIHL